MTQDRRVSTLRTPLSPTQLVLRWLAEAHSFGSIDAWMRSVLATPRLQSAVRRHDQRCGRGSADRHARQES